MQIKFKEISSGLFADNENRMEVFLPSIHDARYVLYAPNVTEYFTKFDRLIKYLTNKNYTVSFLPTKN